MKTFTDFLIERFITIGFNPSQERHREHFRQQIHNILHQSYKAIDGYGGLKSGSQEEHDAIHDDITNSGIIKLTHRNGVVTSVALYKKQHGRKLIAIGTNGSKEGKEDFGRIAKEDHHLQRAWVEASGALEHVYKKIGYPSIHHRHMSTLTGKNDIEPVSADNDHHYTRSIGGHRHQKIGLGHPSF